ncbi:metallophosphoesterase [Levilactobacillus humaensis]|uniref:metallophosphoesterase n=1 Tax=Levilactobacillus humaensis TaxID=2950375 RepID=UPI0021C2DA6D|nr:metallophosphoesterase [Levilactobacillus humaensis]
MSQWLVVSDNHGDTAILSTLRDQLNPDAIFHCGDSEMPASDPWFKDAYAVGGNMDFDAKFPLVLTPKVAGRQVLLTHGHHDEVKYDLTQLDLRAQAAQATIIFYGHTHRLAAEQVDGRLFVNPGSISQPRGEYRYLGGTAALVTVTATQTVVQYVDRQAQPIADLKFTFDHLNA